ncbi:MAG TPA: DUF2177 family protein [Rhizomicrobium sp.]|jgi:uncharacterized membrane protein
MLRYVLAFVASLLVLIAGDAVWLSYFARALFRPTVGTILLDEPRWFAVAIFYPLYAAAILVFAVNPIRTDAAWQTALLRGALLGLVAYGTYDLTNLATIRVWTTRLALIDTGWGIVLTAFAALAACLVEQRFQAE